MLLGSSAEVIQPSMRMLWFCAVKHGTLSCLALLVSLLLCQGAVVLSYECLMLQCQLLSVQAIELKQAMGCKRIGVLDIGAGSGLLSMMAARYAGPSERLLAAALSFMHPLQRHCAALKTFIGAVLVALAQACWPCKACSCADHLCIMRLARLALSM